MKKYKYTYSIDKSRYINITNQCPNSCSFCIRNNMDTVGDSCSLWLDKDPDPEDIIRELQMFYDENRDNMEEIVFCGYGEPLVRLNEVVEICKYIRENIRLPIRINTNGLSDLIHNRKTAADLEGLCDIISISLNAPTAEEYIEICRPVFGLKSFEAIKQFASDCKKYIPTVILSVVDTISPEQIAKSRLIAEELGVNFRVRNYTA